MTLQSEFRESGEEYARRLDRQAEADRLAALIRETRHEDNATAFAAAIEAALTGQTATTQEETTE